jgi:hypothetical protein
MYTHGKSLSSQCKCDLIIFSGLLVIGLGVAVYISGNALIWHSSNMYILKFKPMNLCVAFTELHEYPQLLFYPECKRW